MMSTAGTPGVPDPQSSGVETELSQLLRGVEAELTELLRDLDDATSPAVEVPEVPEVPEAVHEQFSEGALPQALEVAVPSTRARDILTVPVDDIDTPPTPPTPSFELTADDVAALPAVRPAAPEVGRLTGLYGRSASRRERKRSKSRAPGVGGMLLAEARRIGQELAARSGTWAVEDVGWIVLVGVAVAAAAVLLLGWVAAVSRISDLEARLESAERKVTTASTAATAADSALHLAKYVEQLVRVQRTPDVVEVGTKGETSGMTIEGRLSFSRTAGLAVWARPAPIPDGPDLAYLAWLVVDGVPRLLGRVTRDDRATLAAAFEPEGPLRGQVERFLVTLQPPARTDRPGDMVILESSFKAPATEPAPATAPAPSGP
jgi:hypothetical protein